MIGGRYFLYGALVLLVAGCISVPDARFYTLSEPSESSESSAISEARDRRLSLSSGPIFIDVMPVNVPERLARPQLVPIAPNNMQRRDHPSFG